METAHELSAAQLDRLYRLTWLVWGDPQRAARRLQARGIRVAEPAGLSRRIEQLAAQRQWLYRLHVPARAHERSGLTPRELTMFAQVLGRATPQARRDFGAPHLLGDEAPALRPASLPLDPTTAWPKQATDAVALLALLARAWGDLPTTAPYAVVYTHAAALLDAVSPEVVTMLRADLLDAGAHGEVARTVRSGLRRTLERVGTAVPALFAGEAPAHLHALHDPTRPRPPALPRTMQYQLGLAGLVLVFVLAIVLRPAPAAPIVAPLAQPAAVATLAPHELVEAALNRSLRHEDVTGVMYERYRLKVAGKAQTLERWYEPAAQRVRVELRDTAERVLFSIATNGQDQVQLRLQPPGASSEPLNGNDYTVDQEMIGRMLPIMRNMPDSMHVLGAMPYVNPEQFYLTQAYSAALRDLGTTVVADRPARLISFVSRLSLPPGPFEYRSYQERVNANQVLLAIDPLNFALLEVRVLPQQEATGDVITPWQVVEITQQATVAQNTFVLPALPEQNADALFTGARLVSPRVSWVPDDMFSDLPSLLRLDLLLQLPPPDGDSIGYALRAGTTPVLVRESVHEILMVTRLTVFEVQQRGVRRENRRRGALRYQMIYNNTVDEQRNISVAAILLPDGGELQFFYQHAYITEAEREERLADLLGALEPLTIASAPTLAADFVR